MVPASSRLRQIQAFKAFGLPGMTLIAPERPLIKRCPDCGEQKISQNKQRCGFCQQLVWRELAEQIGEDRELLDAMLERNCPNLADRREMSRNLKPYLKFNAEAPHE